MDTAWWLLGVAVLLVTLVDVFLTTLNYEQAGLVAGSFSRGLWRGLRTVTHRLPRDRRPVVLRQVTGAQVIGLVLLWGLGAITGYGLIYYGLMTPTSFRPAAPRDLSLFDAMYFSAAQLATVGGSDLTPTTDLLRFLSVAESLTGVVVVSMILTFLLGVYDVIGSLNRLCTRFVSTERGAGSPVATLRPYLRPGGTGVDGHLDAISDAFADYTSGVRLHHAAYYFQSGRDRFALPYALRMVAGILGALRWGLPTGHPASTSPTLPALTFQYLEFGEYLQATVRWGDEPEPPQPVDRATFERIVRDGARVEQRDGWVARFTRLETQLADVMGSDPLAALDDAHRRYTQWLPFAYRAEVITTRVSRDLDYQPVIVTEVPVSLLHGDGVAVRNIESYVTDPVPPRDDRDRARVRGWLSGRLSLLDPGGARLRLAVRGLVCAVVAALSALVVAGALGEQDQARPVIFAGFVAMLASGAVAGRGAARRLRTAVTVLTVVLVVVALAAVSSGSHLWTGVVAVMVAVVAAWVGRFGPRYASLGTVGFMAFYYALIMRLEASDVVLYAACAGLGVAWPLLLGGVLMPERPARAVRAALDSYRREMVAALEVLEDAAAWGRWDRVLARRHDLAQRRLQRGSEFLAGRLSTGADEAEVDAHRARSLRLHIFSANLAEEYLAASVRAVPAAGVSLELRGRVAGRLELLRAHVVQVVLAGADGPQPDDWRHEGTPSAWPREAQAAHRAVEELADALDSLRRAERGAAPDPEADDAPDVLPAAAPTRGAHAPAPRRAVQAGLAVAAGLLIGDALSSSHQYWAMLAAYQVLGASDAETFVKGGQRVAGTVAGAVVGFGVAIATGGDPVALVIMVATGIFGSLFNRGVSTAVQVFFTMVMFSTVYETLGRLTSGTVELRIVETVAGAAAALVIAAVVLPTRTRVLVDRDLARLVRDLQAVLGGVFGRLERGDGAASTATLNSRLLVVDDQVRRIGATADPLLRSGGVLDAGGVQQRLTAVRLVAYDVRYLVHAVERADALDADLTARDWAALQTTTADNLAALLAILEHRSVPAVHEDLGSALEVDPYAPGADHERAILRRVDRVNRTLVLLIMNLAPDAVEPAADVAPAAG